MRDFLPLLALLVACEPPEQVDYQPPGPRWEGSLDLPPAPGAYTWRALDHLDRAELAFPDDNLPDHRTAPPSVPLSGGWTRVRSGRVPVYARKLPVDLPPKRYRSAPAGLSVSQEGGADWRYRSDLDRRGGPDRSWAVEGERLYVASRTPPDELDPPLLLHQPGAVRLEQRLSYALAEREPADFARLEVTAGLQTRPCLYLPAPASASWQLELPDSPVLDFGYALRDPVTRSRLEGHASFRVQVNGETIWEAEASTGDPFRDASLPLDRWAGQRVTLTFSTDPLGDPTHDYAVFSSPTLYRRGGEGTRRIVVVGIDTLRPDHLGFYGYERPTSPEMDALARYCVTFDQAWAPAPRTRPSFRSAFTGLYPFPAVDGTYWGEVFSRAGFATAGFSANVHLVPRFGFNRGFDLWSYENGAKAGDQVDRALDWLSRHAEEDSFVFLHLMDPHIFYDAPGRYKNLFVDHRPRGFPELFNRWDIYRMQRRSKLSDEARRYVVGRYDGELRYTSAELGRFLQALDALPGRTLLVVHSDHGEEFWDHGGFEHNHSLYRELVHVLLWLRPPGGLADGPRRVSTPVSLLDLAPTLFDAAEVPAQLRPPVTGISLRPLVEGGPAGEALARELEERPLHVGYLMYDTERWGVLYHQHFYQLQTMSGAEELYDLAADPTEQHDLLPAHRDELPRWRRALEAATGWPVGRGWRVQLSPLKAPLVLRFDRPLRAAGVIDPEAGRERRANLEWGEKAPVLPSEVAAVTLSEDRLSVTIQPGSKPTGTVYLLFEGEEPESARLVLGDDELEVSHLPRRLRLGGSVLRFEPGTLIAPQDSMAKRLHQREVDEASLEALRALGYIQ